MSVSALKRLWPSFVAPRVRTWIMQHVFSGTVERIDVAINRRVSTLPANGPPMPDDGLAVDRCHQRRDYCVRSTDCR